MSSTVLVDEAEYFLEHGNHHEAVARLTKAANLNPSSSESSRIDTLVSHIGGHVMQNQEQGSADKGLGESFIDTIRTSSNGSAKSQLGKLALLTTVLSSNKKGTGGYNFRSLASVFGSAPSGGMSGSSLASLATAFYGGESFKHANTGTFSNLSSLVTSYFGGDESQKASQSEDDIYEEQGHGNFSELASTASSYFGRGNEYEKRGYTEANSDNNNRMK